MGWWKRLGDTDDLQRVTLYTRVSLIFLLCFGPLVAGGAGSGGDSVWILLGAVVLQTVAVAWVIDRQITVRPLSRAILATWGVLSLLAALTCLLLPAVAHGPGRGPALGVVFALAIAPLGRWGGRRYLPVAVVEAVIVTLVSGADEVGLAIALGSYLVAAFCTVAGTVQISLWLVDVVRRLSTADADRARLAVAEERLRFARDLHDVVGRDLSAIAVTSDLVAELARRGRPEAVDRAEEVRALAQDSMRKVRAVVRGYRSIDLTAELDGSAALLGSAGITCTVGTPPEGLSVDVTTAAAWVVREGATNVLRHATATWCRIDVAAAAGRVTIRVQNDGAGPEAGQGSGLVGLAERLRPLGGVVRTERGEGTFLLSAELPASAVLEEVR